MEEQGRRQVARNAGVADRVEREGTWERLKIRNHQEEVNQGKRAWGIQRGRLEMQAKVRFGSQGESAAYSQQEAE